MHSSPAIGGSSASRLSALLLVAGAAHLVRPAPFDAIVPRWLPGEARRWTRLSGVAELACGAALAVPRTRRRGAQASAALFLAVLPVNVQMAIDHRRASRPAYLLLLARIPLQVPLIGWARRVASRG